MATCAGCGEALAPAWKFCIHCGLAVGAHDAPATAGRSKDVKHARRISANGRAYIIGGIGIFVVGVALLVIAIAFLTGAIH
jgi:uncharacterized membrane protein YvbJ